MKKKKEYFETDKKMNCADGESQRAGKYFEKLYESQKKRLKIIKQADFFDMRQRPLVIGIADGDGIGPVIVSVAQKVLCRILSDEINQNKVVIKKIEGLTIENRLQCNESVPETVMQQIRNCNVLLKGPTTTPNGGNMTSANVTLRKEFDLFANIRPVKVPSLGIDWTFFRENTEGEYILGSMGFAENEELSFDFKVTTRAGTYRIAKAAFDYAVANGKTHVSVVTKANIMKKTDGLFSKTCFEVASLYPQIKTEEYYVDIMSALLSNPEQRQKFQVILTPNLYGDILTDEAAQIQGGVGTAGSANLGNSFAMFEAIHGSAPRLIEEGLISYADPRSILSAVVLLLSHIGRKDLSVKLEKILDSCTEKGIRPEPSGMTCVEFGNYVLSCLSDISC